MDDEKALNTTHKAEIILLTGFLGSGKTTLLKHILAWETDLSDTIVVVNEFGDVGIDGALLKNSGSDVVELNSGCICCTLSADLHHSLEKICKKYQPSRILIESSGVADPTAVSQVLADPDLDARMTLKKTIAVLDADLWSAKEAFGRLFFNQLEMADQILLNKIDLLEAEKIRIYLNEIHDEIPNAQVVPTIQCRVDPETLWAEAKPKIVDLKTIDFYQSQTRREPVAAAHYESFSFSTKKPLEEARFVQFVEKLPFECFRMKGPVRFPDRVVMVNFVGGRSSWSAWVEDTETKLVFIGWKVKSDEILAKLERCLIP